MSDFGITSRFCVDLNFQVTYERWMSLLSYEFKWSHKIEVFYFKLEYDRWTKKLSLMENDKLDSYKSWDRWRTSLSVPKIFVSSDANENFSYNITRVSPEKYKCLLNFQFHIFSLVLKLDMFGYVNKWFYRYRIKYSITLSIKSFSLGVAFQRSFISLFVLI